MDTLLNEIFNLQKDYWAINKDEKEILLAQFPDSIEWKNLLRLHHLLCMEALESMQEKLSHTEKTTPIPGRETIQLLQRTTNMLLGGKSPYRPRQGEIEFDILTRQGSLKKFTGVLMNASLTHLGSIEVVWVDSDLNPVSMDFLPLDQLQSIMNNTKGALITYKNKKEKDICYLATHYFFSPACKKYINNTQTEYVYPLYEANSEEPGIGLGVQEFVIIQDNNSKEYTPINKNAIIKLIPDMYEFEYNEKVI